MIGLFVLDVLLGAALIAVLLRLGVRDGDQ
jgi:hypothetical protein